jgi:xanthine dehydrogenase YagR molybdenum-binding subunit
MGGVVLDALTDDQSAVARLRLCNRRFLNTTLEEYPMPVDADIHQIEVDFIDEPDLLFNPIGIKGEGEVCMVGSAATIANAVYHATGHRVHRLPTRLEHVL